MGATPFRGLAFLVLIQQALGLTTVFLEAPQFINSVLLSQNPPIGAMRIKEADHMVAVGKVFVLPMGERLALVSPLGYGSGHGHVHIAVLDRAPAKAMLGLALVEAAGATKRGLT